MNIIKARQELSMGKSIYDMELRVVNYDRVSTDKEEQLNSLVNQANYFNDMIREIKKWSHVKSYVDEGISGTQVYKRDEFLRMVDDARLGKFDLIVTKEISRFARNTIDSIKYTELLLSYGVIVFFVSDNINTINPDSEFRLTLMASMAQDEVRKLSERVKFGIRRSIKDGKVVGGGIYGYIKKNSKLVIDEKEAPVVRKIFSLYSSGEYGFRKISELLAEEGHYTRKGKVFSDTTLKKMIKNPRYKGWYTANLSEVEDYRTHKKIAKAKEEWIIHKDDTGVVPAIVSEELWDQANEIYSERNKRYNKNVLNKEYYIENRNYTSKIFCMEHNTSFIRTASGKRKNNPVWQCNEYLRHGIKGCVTPRLFEKTLDKLFISLFEKIIDINEILQSIYNDYLNIFKDNSNKINVDKLNTKLSNLKISKERLLDLYLSKMISKEQFNLKNTKLNDEINIIREKMYNTKSKNQYLSFDKIKNNLKNNIYINKNLGRYIDIFIKKIFVKKIDNDRKHILLKVVFNYSKEDEFIEMNTNIKNR